MEESYIRDADMNLARIPEGVSLEQAVMVPDMMPCTPEIQQILYAKADSLLDVIPLLEEAAKRDA